MPLAWLSNRGGHGSKNTDLSPTPKKPPKETTAYAVRPETRSITISLISPRFCPWGFCTSAPMNVLPLIKFQGSSRSWANDHTAHTRFSSAMTPNNTPIFFIYLSPQVRMDRDSALENTDYPSIQSSKAA